MRAHLCGERHEESEAQRARLDVAHLVREPLVDDDVDARRLEVEVDEEASHQEEDVRERQTDLGLAALDLWGTV